MLTNKSVNELDRYLFDLQGFLVVEAALTPQELALLNEHIDRHLPEETLAWQCFRHDGLLGWGSPFRALIDNPRLTPYLAELLGKDFRLDHDYLHLIRSGSGPIGSRLHGGGTPFDPCQYYTYKNGRMYNGLVAVAYNLTDVPPGVGGFGCIPGSHKSNRPLPEPWRDLASPPDVVRAVSGKAGTAIIFTEALTHGTLPWKGESERRTLFYKYSPHPSAWSRNYYDSDAYTDLTQVQRYILRTPGVHPN